MGRDGRACESGSQGIDLERLVLVQPVLLIRGRPFAIKLRMRVIMLTQMNAPQLIDAQT